MNSHKGMFNLKLLKPGDSLTLPGAENKIGLTVIGYEIDDSGQIWYQVAPSTPAAVYDDKLVVESPITQ